VVITGTGFTGTTQVDFNNTVATFVVDTDTQITATVPANATTGPINVTTPGSTTASATFTVTVIAVPTISGINPTTGGIGTSVVITGTGFTGTTQVNFNGTPDSGYTVDSDTQITTTVPANTTTGPINVTTPGGTAASATFTVIPAPTISSINPTAGGVGTSVVITGTGFTGTTQVDFNGIPDPGFVADSDTQITAAVPAGATTGPINVTTPGGSIASATFTVIPAPTISGISPTTGGVGTTVVITGRNFGNTTQVDFNGTPDPGFVVSPNKKQITATVPAGATTGPINVTTPSGTAASTTFTVPGISSIDPGIGGVGASVVITGSGLTGTTQVDFNGTPDPGFVVDNDTQITATVPVGATSGPINLTISGDTVTGPVFTILLSGQDGDLAPLGAPDGILDTGDLLIMQRIVLGQIVASALELQHGDLYPSSAPDGVIDLSDLILQQRLLLEASSSP
jgi:hypothetical protein